MAIVVNIPWEKISLEITETLKNEKITKKEYAETAIIWFYGLPLKEKISKIKHYRENA